jgi:hypothetical protein
MTQIPSPAWGNGLPDPSITGPCQIQSSFLCEPAAGVQRMNPMDMLLPETSFGGYTLICQACYDQLATLYVAGLHGRI